MAKLTAKQQMFVREYLCDLNATQAAIRAGYSWKSPSGFYVYFLVDPRDGNIFYVGKGKGQRFSKHVRSVQLGRIDNAAKGLRIREILLDGLRVQEVVFESNLDEDLAYSVERELICLLRNFGLTNIAKGIVTSEENLVARRKEMLARLKPYDVWINTLDDFTAALAVKVFGSLSNAYFSFKEALESC